jgi:hypothetical protein
VGCTTAAVAAAAVEEMMIVENDGAGEEGICAWESDDSGEASSSDTEGGSSSADPVWVVDEGSGGSAGDVSSSSGENFAILGVVFTLSTMRQQLSSPRRLLDGNAVNVILRVFEHKFPGEVLLLDSLDVKPLTSRALLKLLLRGSVSSRKWVIWPTNDTCCLHWLLLVCDVQARSFFFLDPLNTHLSSWSNIVCLETRALVQQRIETLGHLISISRKVDRWVSGDVVAGRAEGVKRAVEEYVSWDADCLLQEVSAVSRWGNTQVGERFPRQTVGVGCGLYIIGYVAVVIADKTCAWFSSSQDVENMRAALCTKLTLPFLHTFEVEAFCEAVWQIALTGPAAPSTATRAAAPSTATTWAAAPSTATGGATPSRRRRRVVATTFGGYKRNKTEGTFSDHNRTSTSDFSMDAALFTVVPVDAPGDCVYRACSLGLLVGRGIKAAVPAMRHQVSEELLHPYRRVEYGWSSEQQPNYELMAMKMREMGVWSLELNTQVLPALANVFQVTFVVWARSSDLLRMYLQRSFEPSGQPHVTASQVLLGKAYDFIHLLSSPSHYDQLIFKPTDKHIPGPRMDSCAPAGVRKGNAMQSASTSKACSPSPANAQGKAENMLLGRPGAGWSEDAGIKVQKNTLLDHIHLGDMLTEEQLSEVPVAPFSRVQALRDGLARIKTAEVGVRNQHALVVKPNVKQEQAPDGARLLEGNDRAALFRARTEGSCCGDHCLLNRISIDAHLAALNTKNDLRPREFFRVRLEEISRFSRSACLTRRTYVVGTNVVCREAYRRLHGIPDRTLSRWLALADAGHTKPVRFAQASFEKNGVASPRETFSPKELSIHAWLKVTLPVLTEYNPTKRQMTIQLETYRSLHDRYKDFCERYNVAECSRGTRKDMSRVLRRPEWTAFLSTRFNPDVGVCTLCQTLTSKMMKVDASVDKAKWKELVAEKSAHRASWEGRRHLTADMAIRGAQLKEVAVALTDGADSSKTMCPTLACHTKMEDVQAVTLKLQGVALQGAGVWVFIIHEFIKSGANVLCTCLLLACQKAATHLPTIGRSMPRKLIVVVDGGSENWNLTTLRFFCLLVHAGVYDVMELIRCPPGHGHNQLDGLYGFLSQELHGVKRGPRLHAGTDVFTLSQFKQAALKSLSGSDLHEMIDVDFAWDFVKYLEPYILPDMGGHGANNRGDFTFGANVTWWKVEAHMEGHGPTKTRGVYLSHKLGFQDNLETSGWRPTLNSGKGYLVTGFENLPPMPGYHNFDEVKLTEFKGTKRAAVINQFRSPVESATVDMLSTHGRENPDSIQEWEAFFEALPESPDAAAHVQTLRNKKSHVVPEFVLPTFERTGEVSLTESSQHMPISVALDLKDKLEAKYALDPVYHDAEEKRLRNGKLAENSEELEKEREMVKMQVEAVSEQTLILLEGGDLVVLAVVDQILPFMVAEVLNVGRGNKYKKKEEQQLKVKWYEVKNITEPPTDKVSLIASIRTAVFHPHTQDDWFPRSSVMLCHPLLTQKGRTFSAQKRVRSGQQGGKAQSTQSEMLNLVEIGILCK